MTLNWRSSTRGYWAVKYPLELERQFLVSNALLYVDAVYSYY
jgi:hypothetical protein